MESLTDWKRTIFFLVVILLTGAVSAGEIPQKSETYSFKVRGDVSYRCYGGYGAQKDVDSRTKVACDNSTKKETLVNEVVTVQIKAEPNPDDSKDMDGDWVKDVQFEGRKFTAFLSLFKAVDVPSKNPYQLTVDAHDDEPSHRTTSTFAVARQVKDLNALTVRYSSKEQPEEIEFTLQIEPVQ
jgi:hypothetical protein